MTIGKDETRSVQGSRVSTIGKDDGLQIKGKLNIDAGDSITLTSGSASISMKKDGTIEIKGKAITVDGSDITIKGSGNVNITGSKINNNS